MADAAVFDIAVDRDMLYEVGGFWMLTPEVRAGLIETKQQRKACGYINDPNDRGGETKYGISKNSNPDVDIAALDWDTAKRIYFKNYWLMGDCQNMPARLAILHFDGCVNHGVGRASKFLQIAVGAEVDGDIGPATLSLIDQVDEIELCNRISSQREDFYKIIVQKNPSQGRYLNGWLRRIREMNDYVTDMNNIFE